MFTDLALCHTVLIACGCVLLVCCGTADAQGTRADYERANSLRALTEGKVLKARIAPHWFAGNNRFWYRNDLSNGRREFVVVDAVAGTRSPAFDHARVAAALGSATGQQLAPDALPVDAISFGDDGHTVMLFVGSDAWELDTRSYTLRRRPDVAPPSASLTPLPRPHPTRSTGEETSITFENRTKAELHLFWLDTDGQRRPYGTLPPGAKRTQHTYEGHVWLVADAAGRTIVAFQATAQPGTAIIDAAEPVPHLPAADATPEEPQGVPSPDGRWLATIKDHNVWLADRQTGHTAALTTDGTEQDGYDGRPIWSPDGKHLVAMRTQAGEEHKIYFVESSPSDQVQPKLHSISYLKPGDRIPITKPHLFDVDARKEIPISDRLFPNPWEIGDVRWDPDSARFTFLYNQRGHQVMRIIAVDARTGSAQAIVDEQSKTFIDYAGKGFTAYLDATHEIVWMSERDGWNHLYLYDARTGELKNQITKGQWVVRGVDRVDPDRRQVWFRLSGYYPQQDPYYVHYARINLDGTGLVMLTQGDGTHSIEYSPDGRFYIDTYSRVDMPPVHELRRSEDGKLVCALERADATALLAAGWRPPIRFAAKGRDGNTDIYGIIIVPTNLDPSKRYPVIENIYAGPQSSSVPKAWSSYYPQQEIAELGFVVVMIDGMGTSNRSKAFHDVCWKNLGDAGFPDRIPWIKAAARRYPYMDISRVGIYGGSAGGQNALRGLLEYPDFYKVGAADCGCHDNRVDKIWWNELWMGWPVGPEYEQQSNVTNAHKLQGKLLLTVGEMDTNVDPASTMQVVNALIKADKDFDLLVVPGVGHGAGETPYARRRRQDFFVRNLLGVEPRSR